MAERSRAIRRTAIESYKLVIEYMRENNVAFSRAIEELGAPKSSLYVVRRSVVEENKIPGVTAEEMAELKVLSQWLEDNQRNAPYRPGRQLGQNKPVVPAPIPLPAPVVPQKPKAERLVCLVGSGSEISKALAEIFK